MKKYLYFVIPFLKWLSNFLVIMFMFNYVMVVALGRWVDIIVGLTLSAIVAGVFAYWAFYPKVMDDKRLAWFILSWVAVTFLSEFTLDYLTLYRPYKVLLSWEFLAQTLVEILVVLVMSRVLKRHQTYHETAEGIDIRSGL